MHITVKSVPELNHKEYKDCWWLNLGADGTMRPILEEYRSYPKNQSRVTMMYEGDKLIAWSLKFLNEDKHWELHVYVRAAYRRRGLGRILLGRARKGVKRPLTVQPHSPESDGLYARALQAGRVIG